MPMVRNVGVLADTCHHFGKLIRSQTFARSEWVARRLIKEQLPVKAAESFQLNGSNCSVDQLKMTAMMLTSGANSAASRCFVQSSCLPYIGFAATARGMTTHGEGELHTRSQAYVCERLAIRCVGICGYCMCLQKPR